MSEGPAPRRPLVNPADLELVAASGLFDPAWYLARYPDVGLLALDPVEHFLWLGARLLRNPSPLFDTRHYVRTYPDVAARGVNPLVHYLRFGRAEGRHALPDGQGSVQWLGRFQPGLPGLHLVAPAYGEGRRAPGTVFVRLLLPFGVEAIGQQWNVVVHGGGALPDPAHPGLAVLQRDVAGIDLDILKAWLADWRDAGGRLIHDVDDDLLDVGGLSRRNIEPAAAADIAARVRLVADAADAVTVSTPALAARFAGVAREVVLLPNRLDAGLWHLDEERAPPASPVVRIGYIGTPTHDEDIALVTETMRDLEARHGAALRIEVVGAFQRIEPPFGRRVPLPQRNDYPHFAAWLLRIVDWDIGIIPLADNAFNRAKSNLKFLEYAALGLAIVCSAGETYADIAVDGENALVVPNTPAAWHAAIERLIADPALRRRLAGGARRTLRQAWTLDHGADTYRRFLAGLADDLPPMPAPDAPVLPADDGVLLRESPLFDAEWYRGIYPDIARSRTDPVHHYLRHGWREGRVPGPGFNPAWYVENYKGAVEGNPLVQYLRVGRGQGYLPRPPLDVFWWGRLQAGGEGGAPRQALETRLRLAALDLPPAVVVPVYNAPEEVEVCLDSLLAHGGGRIIVIDDASPDPRIAPLLARYHGRGGIEIHANEVNLGFTRTVNRGIGLAGRADVVFLNADTEVTPGWLRKLRQAAYSGAMVATATALSDNAGAFSAPEIGVANSLPHGLSFADLGRALGQASLRLYPEVPTGNGFCLYVRRDALDAVGLLDAEAFPRGYGEENDFCMRAVRAGWRHVIDDATYIHHVRSASFGSAKDELMRQGRAVIDQRYPDYGRLVHDAFRGATLARARARVGEVAEAAAIGISPVLPRLLFVLSTRTGGTPQTNEDLMRALAGRFETFVLRCNARVIELMSFSNGHYVHLDVYILENPLTAFPHRSTEYDSVIASWLLRHGIDLVHIRHIGWHGLGLVEGAKALGLPVVFSFHDFYTICPTVKLLDQDHVFCGGRCTASPGDCHYELWPAGGLPPLKAAAVHDWRRQMAPVLAACDMFVTTTPSARRLEIDAFPLLADRPFAVVPHGRDFPSFENLASPHMPGEPLRLLVPGAIGLAKGGAIITGLAALAEPGELEIHLLGTLEDGLVAGPGMVVHGAYKREDFVDHVRRIAPHAGAVLSVWAETYSHTLTELWAAGLPVIGCDFGAVGDRLRDSGAGWLLAEPTAEAALALLRRLRREPAEWAAARAAVSAWQEGPGQRDDTRHMADAYAGIYQALLNGSEARG